MDERIVEEAKQELLAELRYELTSIIHEEMLSLLEEAMFTDDQKEYKKRKGAKAVDKNEPGVTRVEAVLRNNDFPSNLATAMTKIAKTVKQLATLKKEVEDDMGTYKDAIKDKVDELFGEADNIYTRQLETAGLIVVVSKATTQNRFDKEEFIRLVKEKMGLQTELVLKLLAEAHNVIDISSSVSIELKEEGIADTLKQSWSKFTGWVKDMVSSINKKDKEIKKEISKAVGITNISAIVNESTRLGKLVESGKMTLDEALESIMNFSDDVKIK